MLREVGGFPFYGVLLLAGSRCHSGNVECYVENLSPFFLNVVIYFYHKVLCGHTGVLFSNSLQAYMSFCHFKLTITNLLVLSVVAALFLSLFSGLLISAQAQQDTLDPALFPASRKGSTATITATDATGTAVTSYSNSTDLIKIPMTWKHTRKNLRLHLRYC